MPINEDRGIEGADAPAPRDGVRLVSNTLLDQMDELIARTDTFYTPAATLEQEQVSLRERVRRSAMQNPFMVMESSPSGFIRSSRSTARNEERYEHLLRAHRSGGRTIEELADTENAIPCEVIESSEMVALSPHVRGVIVRNGRVVDFQCQNCAKTLSADGGVTSFYLSTRNIYCDSHIPELEECSNCRRLAEGCQEVPQSEGRPINLCPPCMGSSHSCRECGDRIDLSLLSVGHCDDCLDDFDEEETYRNYSLRQNNVGSNQGEIVKSPRIFSAELEVFAPSVETLIRCSRELSQEMGVTEDGSLRADEDESRDVRGFEIQTPKLAGDKGEAFIKEACRILNANECEVNNSCGFHIHLDGGNILPLKRKGDISALMHLWKAYLEFEDVIHSFLPYERRRNDYCRPISEYFSFGDLDMVQTLLEAEKLWYKARTYGSIVEAKQHKYHSSRYFGVNLHSLLGSGHLEIRYHSGTTNRQKILEWVNLHALIMDAAEARVFGRDFLREAHATSNRVEKTLMLFDAISLSESSRDYFLKRQKKFAKKNEKEDKSKE